MNGLVLEGVSAGYGETVVLEGISLDLPPERTLAVLGRNGVGKTTLLATVMGHTRLRGGRIRFARREISGLAPYRLCASGARNLPLADCRGESDGRRAARAMVARQDLRIFPVARRAPPQSRQSAIGRRAAYARHRPRIHGQPDIAT